MSLKEEGPKAASGSRHKHSPPEAIRRQKEFTEIFKRGEKTTLGNLSLWFTGGEKTGLSIVISAKQGSASKRNRARRLVKEYMRKNEAILKQGLRMVIKIDAPLPDNNRDTIERLSVLFKKAGLI